MPSPPRGSWEWVWRPLGFYVLCLFAYSVIHPGGQSPFGWAFKALLVGWAVKVTVAVILKQVSLEELWSLLRGTATTGQSLGAEGEEETPGAVVRAKAARLGGGAYLGTGRADGWICADPESAVMVLGPPRSGKTSAVMVPAVIAASGPVVATSTKPEVMGATLGARSEIGQAWVFDPAVSAERLPEEARRLCWSPVAAAASWDEALVMARAMAACTRPGAGTTNGDHWTERASALLAPLLHAANLTDRPIEAVLRWTLRQEVSEARQVLADCDSDIAADVLLGIERTDARERSSIFSATAGVLAAYNADAVRESAARPNFDPARFAASTDTIYITAPEQRQELCAPLIVGLLEQIRHAVYARARDEAEGPPMLWGLDEVANIAPIHDLPRLVSQAGGQGLQVMVGLQDLSQARGRWGAEAADGFMSLFQTKLVLSGIGDRATLESISVALGEYDRRVVSQCLGRNEEDKWLSPDRTYNESVSYQTQRQRVLSEGEIARLPVGQGLLLRGAVWGLIGLTPWFKAEPWRSAASAGSGLEKPRPRQIVRDVKPG